MAKRLDDKTKKKILADYVSCQNYREVGRKHAISYATVKRIIREQNGSELSQQVTQKAQENTINTLQYMENQHKMKQELLDDILKAMGDKAKKPDMFTNIKDLAVSYGITIDKELKLEEIKLKQKESELKQRELNFNEEMKDRRIQIPAIHMGKAFVDVNRSIDEREYLEYWFLGGRASLKSSYASEKAVEILYNNPNMCAMALRKVKDTLKDSIYAQLQWAIQNLELDNEFTFTKSPMEITRKATGQKIFFRGADDPMKIKSTKPPKDMYIGVVLYEEFDQMAGMNEIRTINQSIIRGGEDFVVFYSANTPKSRQHFVNKEKLQVKSNRMVHYSTYLDAPAKWLGQVFIEEANYLKESNPKAYDHEYLGNDNSDGSSVFDNLTVREIKDTELSYFDHLYYGNDWGWFPDPNHFSGMHYNASEKRLYIFKEVRCNKTKNEAYAKLLAGHENDIITSDIGEGGNKSIADFRDYGFDMRGARKGPGSVEYGLKWLQSLNEIIIDPRRCPHTAREFSQYEYMKDKDGNVISGYPDADNHSIDSVRYAMEDVWRRRGQ